MARLKQAKLNPMSNDLYSNLGSILCSMKDSTAVDRGIGPLNGFFLRHPEVMPSLPFMLGFTNQLVVCAFGHHGNAEIGLPAPPSGALYLMT